ncbi:MAG: hypothetical protein R3A51_18600 [Nannocystaceae bacterium]|nr:hypothetical protein [Myxococcales bacterium]
MKHPTLPLLLLTLACACGPSEGDPTDTDTDTADSSDSLVLTTDGSSGAPTTDATSDSTTDSSTDETTAGTTTADACVDDGDCAEAELCEAGRCEFNPKWCGSEVVKADVPPPPNVVLVLDKSGSMVNPDLFWDDDADDLDDDGEQDDAPGQPATPKVSRWSSLHAVVSLIGSKFDAGMNLGAQLFPSVDAQAVLGAQACLVSDPPEVAVAPQNAAAIIAGIPPAGDLTLAGGTPAEKGVASAITHLMSLPPGDGELAPAPYLILITDGAANCSTAAQSDQALLNYDQNLVPTIAAAADMGIGTYVIGVDIADQVDSQGINPFAVLNEAALAGGHPKEDPSERFYNTINELELEAALEEIIEEVLSCTIAVDLPDYTTPEVTVGETKYEEPLPDGADCETESGWRFTDASMTAIELCGAACANYQTSGAVEIDFVCMPPP